MKKKIVVVSGGFDPVHIGHIRMFKDAKKLGKNLIVVLNNDNWLLKKKGFVFMNELERKEILESIKYVDKVVLTGHDKKCSDMSVCSMLELIRPDVFANGGDRTKTNIPELDVCNKLGIEAIFNVGRGGKIQSSSELIKKILKK